MATAQRMIASVGGSTAIRFFDGVDSRAGDRTVRGVRFGARKWKVGALRREEEFADSQHTQYYVSPRAGCEEKKLKEVKKEKSKKKLKLLKRLSADLQMFVSGREEEDGGGVIISSLQEAQKLLLAELEKLRSEEMEKKKMEEREMKSSDSESSSSSSSESSDSDDCGNNAMVMKSQRKISSSNYVSIPQESSSIGTLPAIEVQAEEVRDSIVSLVQCGITTAREQSNRKIEVCMGGKCKKQGAMALMEDFQRKVGEGAAMVVTCKCMGKCKNAPNVRVSSSSSSSLEDGLLCIGVGLEDVDAIVAKLMASSNDHYLPAMAP